MLMQTIALPACIVVPLLRLRNIVNLENKSM
jgi:hypothetical protein